VVPRRSSLVKEKGSLDPRGREFAFRVGLSMAFLLVVHLHYLNVHLGADVNFPALYVIGAAYLLYSVATYYFYHVLSLKGSLRVMAALIDIATLCTAIHFSGGVESYTFLFLGLAALIGGVYGDVGGAALASVLAMAGYGVVAALDARPVEGYNLAQALLLRYGYLLGISVLETYILDLLLKDRKRLRMLYDVSQSSSRGPALHSVLKEVTQRTAEELRAEVGLVMFYEEGSRSLVVQQPATGIDFSTTSRLWIPLDSDNLLAASFRDGTPLLLYRQQCRSLDAEELLPGYPLVDLIACPLEARGKRIGLLVLANKLSRRGFGRRDLNLALMLAPNVSLFLDNALLFRRSEEKVAQLTSLIRVVDVINTVTNLDQLYNLALDVIKGLFAADRALINLLDTQSGTMRTVRSFGYRADQEEGRPGRPYEMVENCYMLQHDEVFLCTDTLTDRRCPNMLVSRETRSVMCAPMVAGKKVYGILHMTSRYPNAFDQEDATLAKAIGEQIGLALERAQLFEEISQLAITDEMTGLYNTRHLKRVLGEEIKRSLRYMRPFSFIMLDIDYFKNYNDRLGHLRGDEVLRIIANLLQQNTREVDLVFRYGGEEFSVIIPEVSKEEAYTMAERIRRVIQDHVFPFEEEQPGGNLTVSMGVANFPVDASDAEEVIDNADRALYRAKTQGRNRVCTYDPALDGRTFPPHLTELKGGAAPPPA